MSKKIKNIEHRPFGAAKMGTRSVLSFSPLFPSFFLHSFGFFWILLDSFALMCHLYKIKAQVWGGLIFPRLDLI